MIDFSLNTFFKIVQTLVKKNLKAVSTIITYLSIITLGKQVLLSIIVKMQVLKELNDKLMKSKESNFMQF